MAGQNVTAFQHLEKPCVQCDQHKHNPNKSSLHTNWRSEAIKVLNFEVKIQVPRLRLAMSWTQILIMMLLSDGGMSLGSLTTEDIEEHRRSEGMPYKTNFALEIRVAIPEEFVDAIRFSKNNIAYVLPVGALVKENIQSYQGQVNKMYALVRTDLPKSVMRDRTKGTPSTVMSSKLGYSSSSPKASPRSCSFLGCRTSLFLGNSSK
jgi:hypothetical protein